MTTPNLHALQKELKEIVALYKSKEEKHDANATSDNTGDVYWAGCYYGESALAERILREYFDADHTS